MKVFLAPGKRASFRTNSFFHMYLAIAVGEGQKATTLVKANGAMPVIIGFYQQGMVTAPPPFGYEVLADGATYSAPALFDANRYAHQTPHARFFFDETASANNLPLFFNHKEGIALDNVAGKDILQVWVAGGVQRTPPLA